MKRYLKLFGLGLLICGSISWVLLGIVSMAPWIHHQAFLLAACFALTGGYLMSLPMLAYDIVNCRNGWTDGWQRSLAAMAVGSSFGLFTLMWISLFRHDGMEPLQTEQFTRFLCGKGDVVLWSLARELYPQAELLSICKVFIEHFVQYATVSGALAMLIVKALDDIRRRANKTCTSVAK